MEKPKSKLGKRDNPQVVAVLGDAIRDTRETIGRTAKDVACEMDIPYFTMLRWENGERSMSVTELVRIMHYYGLDWRRVGEAMTRALGLRRR